MSRHASRVARVKMPAAIAGLTIVAVVVGVVPGIAATKASWEDSEWARGALGAQNCSAATDFASRGAGALLGGSLLATPLGSIAELKDVTATDDGTVSLVDPPTATPLGQDAYANPLQVSALGAIDLDLGGLLQLPLGTPAGALNQYAQARDDGTSAGAAGLVNDSGGIAGDEESPDATVPTFATVDLSTLLGDLGLSGTEDLTGLRLELGAVAASAALNACDAQWADDVYSSLERDYLVAGLRADIDTPLVGSLVDTVDDTLTTAQNSVDALSGDTGLLNSLTTGVLGGITGLLRGLGLGTPRATVSATVDLSSVRSLLTGSIHDSGGIVGIDLAAGTMTVNVAKLFDATNGLNRQAPNTQLLIDDGAINTLTEAVGDALGAWASSVNTALAAALNAITIDADVTLPVTGTNGGAIDLTITGATVTTLASSVPVTATYSHAGSCGALGVIPAVACLTAETLAGTVTGVLNLSTAILRPLFSTVLTPALTAITSSTAVTGLLSSLQGITAPLVTLLGTTLTGLFGEGSLLSFLVNAQNAPDPAEAVAGNPLPGWAAALPGPVATPYSTGQYDVSAVRIAVVGITDGGVALDLARASVGPNGPAG